MTRLDSLQLSYVRLRLRLLRRVQAASTWVGRHFFKVVATLAFLSFAASLISAPTIQGRLGTFFSDINNISAFRSSLAAIGGALIGATAIVFSLILFSMQVNVERMPHGLFSRLSSDRKLLGSFLGSFSIAVLVAAASLLPLPSQASVAVITAAWGLVSIPVLFILAYRRALLLINPSEQLSLMGTRVRKELRKWGRRAELAEPILRNAGETAAIHDQAGTRRLDAAKITYLQINSKWDQSSRQAIRYSFSYAVRFAEAGDHEVSANAINCMMLINATYCAVKNGAFPSRNLFTANQDSTDGFINATLEYLRQAMRIALSRGDEQLAENALRGMAGLLGVYLKIDYPGRSSPKIHAGLAAGYLQSAVEAVGPHGMPDVMMEGVRLMGRCAQAILSEASPDEAVSLGEKVAFISSAGIARTDHQPVTLTAFEQLADLTFAVIVSPSRDIRFAVRRLRTAISEAATRFMVVPESPFQSTHRSNLGPYFSSTSTSSLRSRLTDLTNELLNRPADDARASAIIDNVKEWSDQVYIEQKKLLMVALQKRSGFTFDVLHFATGMSELFLALSTAPACRARASEGLKRHAVWLISTLSWIPSDADSVSFAETFSVTELLFSSAVNADDRGCAEFYEAVEGLLLSWAIKGGSHDTGWGILESAAEGLICLALRDGSPKNLDILKNKFRLALGANGGPSPETRMRSASELRRSAEEHQAGAYAHSAIDQAISQLDRGAFRSLTREMANILDPPA